MIIELWVLAIFLFLVIVGVVILIVLVGSLIRFFPATLVAILVLLFTGNWLLAGLAFLIVAIIMVILK
jgi:hypothetical protein